MTLDIGTIADLLANGLAVAVLWLGLRSQTRQGQLYANAVVDLVAALRTHSEDARRDGDITTAPPITATRQDGQGTHG